MCLPGLSAIVSVLSPFCFLLSPFLSPFLLMSQKVGLGMLRRCRPVWGLRWGNDVSALSVTAGPFPLAMQHFLVSLLVGHCVCPISRFSFRLPSCTSCWSLCPSSPLLVRHCVRLVSLLLPFVSLLVGHCVRLVSLLLFPFVSLLVGHCVSLVSLSVSFCLPSCLPSCWSLCPPCLPSC